MKKTLLLLIATCLFFSCKKEKEVECSIEVSGYDIILVNDNHLNVIQIQESWNPGTEEFYNFDQPLSFQTGCGMNYCITNYNVTRNDSLIVFLRVKGNVIERGCKVSENKIYL